MKNWLIICITAWVVNCGAAIPEGKFVVTGICIPGEAVKLQQNQAGRVEVLLAVVADSNGHFRFEYPCGPLEIFTLYMETSKKNVPLVVRQGEEIEIRLDKDKALWQGDGASRQEFVREFWQQKQAWGTQYPAQLMDLANYRQGVEQQYKAALQYLGKAGAYEEDIKGILEADALVEYIGKLLSYPFLYQVINGKPAELPAGFYSSLEKVELSSPYLKNLKNSCSFLQNLFVTMESEGFLKSGKDDYLLKRAELIRDPKLREDYLLYVINSVELYGYNQYLGNQFKKIQSWMVTPEGRLALEEAKQKYEESARQNKRLNAGQNAFDFEGTDVDGKQQQLSDYKGKVVVVDVWNTGCKPCIAEIPHLKKLEQQYAGKEVVFISYSLDTKTETWKTFLEKQNLEGNQWINTKAFKSDFAKYYNVHFIPRFMVFSKKGKIVEVYAPRPSSPRLAGLIEEELKK